MQRRHAAAGKPFRPCFGAAVPVAPAVLSRQDNRSPSYKVNVHHVTLYLKDIRLRMTARRPGTRPDPRKIDSQGRIHLPPEVMDALGVKRGDHVGFEVAGSEIRLVRVKWVVDR